MTKRRAIVLTWLAAELAFAGWVGWKIAVAREQPWSPRLSLRKKPRRRT